MILIKATIVPETNIVTLRIGNEFFYLSETEARKMRAEMNRVIERLVVKRNSKNATFRD